MNRITIKMFLLSIGISIFGTACYAFIKGIPIMLLWNWLGTKFFGLERINYFESIGICLFISILTSSINTKTESK